MVEDHLGKKYKSNSEMCLAYHIGYSTYKNRIDNGWTLERALTVAVGKNHICEYTDHLGNTYESIQDLCAEYSIKPATYRRRISSGWTVEKALIYKVGGYTEVHDHLGREFTSTHAMCRAWNIPPSTYDNRIRRGWTVERALTTKKKVITEGCEDHLGNKYKSERSMCKAYKIPFTNYRGRISRGWSVEDALTIPPGERSASKHKSVDHEGNVFESRADMIRYWAEKSGLAESCISGRLDKGWSIEKAVSLGPGLTLGKEYTGWKPIKHVYEKDSERYYLCKRGSEEEVLSYREIMKEK